MQNAIKAKPPIHSEQQSENFQQTWSSSSYQSKWVFPWSCSQVCTAIQSLASHLSTHDQKRLQETCDLKITANSVFFFEQMILNKWCCIKLDCFFNELNNFVYLFILMSKSVLFQVCKSNNSHCIAFTFYSSSLVLVILIIIY